MVKHLAMLSTALFLVGCATPTMNVSELGGTVVSVRPVITLSGSESNEIIIRLTDGSERVIVQNVAASVNDWVLIETRSDGRQFIK